MNGYEILNGLADSLNPLYGTKFQDFGFGTACRAATPSVGLVMIRNDWPPFVLRNLVSSAIMDSSIPSKTIVLLGVGHTNAHIVRTWQMRRIPDARLVCISNFRKATYSGMLPGVLAGLYSPDEMTIDLVRLCKSSGAELIIDEVIGLNDRKDCLLFRDRPPLRFDAISVGVGSIPSFEGVEISGDGDHLLTIKPMQTFLKRLDKAVKSAAPDGVGDSINIVIVGAGAGGTEIAFCLPQRVRSLRPNSKVNVHLVFGSLLPGFQAGTQTRAKRRLEQQGVTFYGSERVQRVESKELITRNGTRIPADLVVWATRATAPTLLGRLNLPQDERGFLLTDATLKSVSGAPIFAVGDTGSIRSGTVPKAGVYAVRQGPVLWNNLRLTLEKKPLEQYQPQSTFLKLLNTGDGKAIGEYLGWSFEGSWAFRWKDHIDRKFMRMFQEYPAPMMVPSSSGSHESHESTSMRCLGCGGKVGGSVLRRALANLEVKSSSEVLIGLDAPDDAAVLKLVGGNPITVTTDFFASPIEDHYLAGRIAALNALSDVWAMGARPVAALAIAVLPFGAEQAQEQVLTELLSGSLRELNAARASLVGGHTIEGPRTSFGFTIVADQQRVITSKDKLSSNELLVLTKPLGSGALLAAHMQAKCPAGAMKELERALLTSNEAAAKSAIDSGASALTDVTGFGLAGHLLEMLQASNVSAHVQLSALPLMFGVESILSEGIMSTLAPANQQIESSIEASAAVREAARFKILFDPQTNGGILYAIAESKFTPISGHTVIGNTVAAMDGPPTLIVS